MYSHLSAIDHTVTASCTEVRGAVIVTLSPAEMGGSCSGRRGDWPLRVSPCTHSIITLLSILKSKLVMLVRPILTWLPIGMYVFSTSKMLLKIERHSSFSWVITTLLFFIKIILFLLVLGNNPEKG